MKTYKRLHESKEVANIHIAKIKAKGGEVKQSVQNGKILLEYSFADKLTVYHGTIPKFANSIKTNGLEDKTGAYSQGWYMVSTDFKSALFHANPDDNKDFVYVFEFEIPIIKNDRWIGYPYLWLGEKRNDNSTWFALMKILTKKFIKKIHKISYNKWVIQKQEGF